VVDAWWSVSGHRGDSAWTRKWKADLRTTDEISYKCSD